MRTLAIVVRGQTPVADLPSGELAAFADGMVGCLTENQVDSYRVGGGNSFRAQLPYTVVTTGVQLPSCQIQRNGSMGYML
jgi:hypothetical protein